MSDLETVDDLISEMRESELETGVPARIIWPGNLREAAIKRIKYWEEDKKLWDPVKEYGQRKFIEGRIIELKDFCNITEEELK